MNRFSMTSLLGSLAVALCAGTTLAADVVYQQDPAGVTALGPYANWNHVETTQRTADNFTLDDSYSVSEIVWWGWMYNNDSGLQSGSGNLLGFEIRIMRDDGFMGAPSTVINQGTFIPMSAVTVSTYAAGPYTGDTYEFSAVLPNSVSLYAGSTYWIAINAVVSDTTASGDLFIWLIQNASGDGNIATDGISGLPTLDGDWDPTIAGHDPTFHLLGDPIIDTDADGLPDADEDFYGTNPFDPDTDNDGLLDGTEVDMWLNGSCVSPFVADSDGDTLSDGAEVALETEPCDADSDDDGIPDPLDPLPNTPSTPGNSNSQVAEALRGVGDVITTFPLSSFNAPNNNAAAARRNALANRYYAAALFAQMGLDLPAAILVFTVELRIDGDSSPPDWMLDSADRDLLRIFTDMTLDMLT